MTGEALVTGGAGYIGAHTVRALQRAGWRVTVLDNLSVGQRDAVPPDVGFVQGDVGDYDMLRRILDDIRPQVVLHFAGSTSAPGSIVQPLRYYENNTAKSRVLIEAVLAAPSRPALLFSSSAAVYGDPEVARVDEAAVTRPINPYGASKLMTEQMLADAASAHGLRYLALRYFNVAGTSSAAPWTTRAAAPGSLLAVALDVARGGLAEVPIYGTDHPTRDGTGVRDYIHVEDLAEAHLATLPMAIAGGGPRVLNCGYGRGWSVLELLAAVERAIGRSLRRVAEPRRPGDPSEVVADNARLLRHTAWRPRRDDLDLIVRDAIAAGVAPQAKATRRQDGDDRISVVCTPPPFRAHSTRQPCGVDQA